MNAKHKLIINALKSHRDIFALDRDNLAINLMDITATSILATMDAEMDVDGSKWAPLGASYKEWKDTVAPGAPIGVLFGHMKQISQLRGIRQITENVATMQYGDDPIAMAHAISFQEGGPYHPPRRFYGLATWTIALLDRY